nr:uncharacterized protein LOC111510461 [Leptinotarsa decemlineata]
MDEKEIERLTRLFEEVPSDLEHFSDSEDSVANPQHENFSDHKSHSEQEIEEQLLIQPSVGGRSHLQYNSKDGTKWNKICHTRNIRTRQENIIVSLPGVIGPAKNASSPIEAWQLFFDDNIITELVESTNIYIESIIHRYKNKSDARPTDILEMRAVIGLLYLAGVYHGGRTSIFEFWSKDGTGVSDLSGNNDTQKISIFAKMFAYG